MKYVSILGARARKELFESWIWYEKQLTGLGDEFETEVLKRIKQIEENPQRYTKRNKIFRETRIKKFPFLIIYRLQKNEGIIFIQSIFHTSRNPKSKYK